MEQSINQQCGTWQRIVGERGGEISHEVRACCPAVLALPAFPTPISSLLPTHSVAFHTHFSSSHISHTLSPSHSHTFPSPLIQTHTHPSPRYNNYETYFQITTHTNIAYANVPGQPAQAQYYQPPQPVTQAYAQPVQAQPYYAQPVAQAGKVAGTQ